MGPTGHSVPNKRSAGGAGMVPTPQVTMEQVEAQALSFLPSARLFQLAEMRMRQESTMMAGMPDMTGMAGMAGMAGMPGMGGMPGMPGMPALMPDMSAMAGGADMAAMYAAAAAAAAAAGTHTG